MSDLLVSSTDNIMLITLNRPASYNTITTAMSQEICDLLDRAEADKTTRCIIITGSGKAFCSGGDLANGPLTDRDVDMHDIMENGINKLLKKISASPLPVITAVNGIAVGAGLGLALAADITIAAESAVFFPSFARLGLSLDGGSSYYFVQKAGLGRAKAMCLLADKISSEAAHQSGLVWGVVEDDRLLEEAGRCARKLAERAPLAMALIKDQLQQSVSASLDDCLTREIRYVEKSFATSDFQEGLKAFQEKRKPQFKGC